MLRCIRSYLEHDMYLAFEQHTEDTLAAGRAILPQFSKLIEVRIMDCLSYTLATNDHELIGVGILRTSTLQELDISETSLPATRFSRH